jgi:hypothetical protein
MEEKVMRRIN